MKICNQTSNQIICQNASIANTVLSRMIGLLLKKSFQNTDGLLLMPCSQIHSIGMKFNFDAVYLDKDYKIIATYNNVEKNRILPYNNLVKSVLELPEGAIQANKLEIGDVLKILEE